MSEGIPKFNNRDGLGSPGIPSESSEKKRSGKAKFMTAFKGASAALALSTMSPSDTPQPNLDTYSQRTTASEELERDGITAGQRKTHKPGISEVVASAVNPFGYSNGGSDARTATLTEDIGRMTNDAYEALTQGPHARDENKQEQLQRAGRMSAEMAQEMVGSREDAWRMYLGLPQLHDTFGVSEYRPEQSRQDIYYYRIKKFLDNFAREHHYDKEYALAVLVQTARDSSEPKFGPAGIELHTTMTDSASGIMGNFTLTKGKDEHGHYISYYDRWDLEGSVEGRGGVVGKPFEIYDRIYYDPKMVEDRLERASEQFAK